VGTSDKTKRQPVNQREKRRGGRTHGDVKEKTRVMGFCETHFASSNSEPLGIKGKNMSDQVLWTALEKKKKEGGSWGLKVGRGVWFTRGGKRLPEHTAGGGGRFQEKTIVIDPGMRMQPL